MPCFYTGSLEGDRALAAEQGAAENAKLITNLTQMLCDVCEELDKQPKSLREHIESPPSFKNCSTQVQNWWQKHKETDKKRREKAEEESKLHREVVKRKALSKLSEEEIKILGLDKE